MRYREGIGVAAFALLYLGAAHAAGDGSAAQEAFFANLHELCGQSFAGATEFPEDPDDPMVGKKLIMSVQSCSEDEIRIPFRVGEDTSRTWLLTLADGRLLFKHDHRHPDGTPDEITMYGGRATADGTPDRQSFPADADTVELIPEAATNVWTLEIDSDSRQFTYYLERHDKPRYKAVFDLSAPA
ncbi:MAG: hypothetical protein H0W33_08245 [Gammaproteobacteria bacterium]|nr:hypothetical protein [Gammaproteobacteria bacterium]